MRRLWCLLLVAPAAGWAEWKDVRVGLEPEAVVQAVGQPLIRSRARGGLFETWTFDHGATVVFVRDRVSFWQAPRARSGPAEPRVVVKADSRLAPRPAR